MRTGKKIMKLQTKLKIENFFNQIQRNFTLMEWFVIMLVVYMLGNVLFNWIFR